MSSIGFSMAKVSARFSQGTGEDLAEPSPESAPGNPSVVPTQAQFPWERVKERREPLVIAHRCGKNNGPENTLGACEKALKNGATGLEVDVQLTAGGELVLYRGNLSELSPNQLAKLTRLSDFLAKIPKNMPIILDLKSPLDKAKALVTALANQLDPEDYPRLLLYATHQDYHPHLRQYLPDIRAFEPRELTRERLAEINFGSSCGPKGEKFAMGYELERKVTLEETSSSKQICEELNLGRSCSALSAEAVKQGPENLLNPWRPWHLEGQRSPSPSQCLSYQNYQGIVVYFATGVEDPKKAMEFYAYEKCRTFAHAIMTDYPKELAKLMKGKKECPVGVRSGSKIQG